MKNKELGKGIKALIRDHSTAKKISGQNIFIKIKDIIPNRDNPRENFDKKDLKELKDSIFKHGILQPLTVRELSDGKYELISGGRRFEAIKQLSAEYNKAKFKKVPVFIRNIESEVQMTELALIENIQRSDLNPIEEAFAFSKLKINFKMNDQQIADSVGKNRSTITNSIRLLNFLKNLNVGKDIIKALQSKTISAGHARPLLDLKPDLQKKIFNKIVKNKLSVRQVEKEVNKYKKLKKIAPQSKKTSTVNNKSIEKIESDLLAYLDSKVKIQNNQNGPGKIIIHFNDIKGLKDIIKIIMN